MYSPPEVLRRCHDLHLRGFSYEFEPGNRVARGFADIGFEEFALVDRTRAVSLLSGREVELNDKERAHFFVVPSVDQSVKYLFESGWDIGRLEYRNQRAWELQMFGANGEEAGFSKSSLHEVLIEALEFAFERRAPGRADV